MNPPPRCSTAAGALLLLAGGCTDFVHGDGQLIEHTVETGSFSAVQTDRVNLKIEVGQRPGVSLTADWNVFPHVSLHVEDDTLFIGLDDDVVVFPSALEVRVSARTLEAVAHRGGADLRVSGLRQPALSVTAGDSGTTELIGEVGRLSLFVGGGAGVRNAQDLLAEEVFIDADTSGSMWATATERISGTLYGVGSLTVHGKPDSTDLDIQGDNEVFYR